MTNFILFLAWVAIVYLLSALDDVYRKREWKELVRFGWFSLAVLAIKFVGKAIIWMINF